MQAPVHMLKVVQIPASTGIVVEGIVRGYALSDTLLIFNPDEQLLQAYSINISTALVQQPTNGCIWLFAKNSSSQCQELSSNTNIGHIEACYLPTDDCADATINAVNEDICLPHRLPEEQRKNYWLHSFKWLIAL